MGAHLFTDAGPTAFTLALEYSHPPSHPLLCSHLCFPQFLSPRLSCQKCLLSQSPCFYYNLTSPSERCPHGLQVQSLLRVAPVSQKDFPSL